VESRVLAGTRYDAELPFDGGIRIPIDGTLLNDPSLQLRVESRESPVAYTSIAFSPCIGTFYQTSLCFSPTRAGLPAGVTIRFQYNRLLTYGDTVRVRLYGFVRRAELIMEPIVPPTYMFSAASWDNGQQFLILTATAEIPRMTVVSVLIPESAGLVIPVDGIQQDDSRFTISTNTPAGIVQPTAIMRVPSIGSFGDQVHLRLVHLELFSVRVFLYTFGLHT
jgi:hypothetical protein